MSTMAARAVLGGQIAGHSGFASAAAMHLFLEYFSLVKIKKPYISSSVWQDTL